MALLQDGYTLMHEHVTIDLSGVKKDLDCRLDCFDETVEEFRRLYGYGVRNILEVTNLGMGRDIDYIKRVEGSDVYDEGISYNILRLKDIR